jgi:hypothetical protein
MSDLYLDQILSTGTASDAGNLLGVQPFMLPEDYASPDTLLQKLTGYFDAAQAHQFLTPKTIVVLPEYIGTWLVAAFERPGVYTARNIQQAMRSLVLHHPIRFGRAYRTAKEADRVTAALFRMKANDMARGYHTVFATLARRYGVTLVAGSILLPEPEVVDGSIVIGTGPLQNISAVFRADGTLYPQLARKMYPIEAEQPFTAPAAPEQLPVFDTAAGRLGVLVCADCWYPESYRQLRSKGVDLLAVPSFTAGFGLWKSPWGGYNGAPAPDDVDQSDIGRLTEAQAWRKYALSARIQQSGARAGINVYLRGRLWDAGSDSGETLAVHGDEVTETSTQGAALVNLWL